MTAERIHVYTDSDHPAGFFWTEQLAVDRYLSATRHAEMLRAVEVEYLAGTLTVEQFEAEIDRYLAYA